MNTMNKLKYILILLAGALLFASCSDDNGFISNVEKGNNIASFTDNTQSVSNISDGEEYPVEVTMKLIGPSVNELSGDYTATIQPDWEGIPEDERAEEGTHFRIDNNQVMFEESNNYLAKFNFTMLTQGITAPLEKSPKLNLKATEITGGEGVTSTGKALGVTLNYACDSNLDQTYDVQTTYTAVDGSVSNHTWTGTWTKTGVGTYRTERVGHWTAATLGGTPGMTLSDVCGNITIPEQNLVDLYSNLVSGTGNIDESTGVITLDYSICAGGDCREYDATYTPTQ